MPATPALARLRAPRSIILRRNSSSVENRSPPGIVPERYDAPTRRLQSTRCRCRRTDRTAGDHPSSRSDRSGPPRVLRSGVRPPVPRDTRAGAGNPRNCRVKQWHCSPPGERGSGQSGVECRRSGVFHTRRGTGQRSRPWSSVRCIAYGPCWIDTPPRRRPVSRPPAGTGSIPLPAHPHTRPFHPERRSDVLPAGPAAHNGCRG